MLARPAAGSLGLFVLPTRGIRASVRSTFGQNLNPHSVLRGPREALTRQAMIELSEESRNRLIGTFEVLEAETKKRKSERKRTQWILMANKEERKEEKIAREREENERRERKEMRRDQEGRDRMDKNLKKDLEEKEREARKEKVRLDKEEKKKIKNSDGSSSQGKGKEKE